MGSEMCIRDRSNAAGMLQFSSDIGLGEMEILPLSEEFRPTEGAGDLVMMTSGSSGEPKGGTIGCGEGCFEQHRSGVHSPTGPV